MDRGYTSPKHTMLTLLIISLAMVSSILGGSPKYCTRPIPGSLKLARGLNLGELDLTPMDGFSVPGFKFPVIQMTCLENHKWHLGYNGSFNIYDRADSLSQPQQVSGSFTHMVTDFMKTIDDVKKTIAVEAKLSSGTNAVSIMPLEFSATYTNLDRKITEEEKTAGSVKAENPASVLRLKADAQIDEYAQKFMDKHFTKSFEEDPKPYEEFIRYFGTHYYARAYFGGKVALFWDIKTKLTTQISGDKIDLAARATFGQSLEVSGKIGAGSKQTVTTFTKNANTKFRYYGGKADLLEKKEGLKVWERTVPLDPWLIRGTLEPISTLLKGDQRKNFDKAINHYYIVNERKELQKLLKQKRGAGDISQWGFDQLSDFVYKSYTKSDLFKLRKEILVTEKDIPLWFYDTTLCFRYMKTPGSRGVSHCNGQRQIKLMCAKPNTALEGYTENTSGRNGCSMQWVISGTDYDPAWFKKTEICIRWENVGGSPKQCNRASKGELCARVDAITPRYIDRTSKSAGYCKLAWRIKVPREAPYWIYKTKLCFSWSSQNSQSDNNKYCGGMAKKETCALTGAWTQYYKDNTDGTKNEGCKMTWKWKA